ncbi:hypothetical protein PVK06_045542 [Gossypium arboreum]|uniref:RNase H type-1 domain-containing protein n=1 Tax=Gossypium arboreum TaxID=29729 RepID=A0ABR0MW86_GOSAR|nr:hypothetical protein PVK06_045542 [Gossypium arboreum]
MKKKWLCDSLFVAWDVGIWCLVVKSDSQIVVDLVTAVIGEEMLELVTVVRGFLPLSWQVLARHVLQGANVAVNAITKLVKDHLLALQLVWHPPSSIKLMVEWKERPFFVNDG